jgi:hypothetical protein
VSRLTSKYSYPESSAQKVIMPRCFALSCRDCTRLKQYFSNLADYHHGIVIFSLLLGVLMPVYTPVSAAFTQSASIRHPEFHSETTSYRTTTPGLFNVRIPRCLAVGRTFVTKTVGNRPLCATYDTGSGFLATHQHRRPDIADPGVLPMPLL